MTFSPVIVQTTPESQPSTPNWMGEVAAFAQILTQTGILTAIIERVRFARARMRTSDLIDVILFSNQIPLPPFAAHWTPPLHR